MGVVEDAAARVRSLALALMPKYGVVKRGTLCKSPVMVVGRFNSPMDAYSMVYSRELEISTPALLSHNVLTSQQQPKDTGAPMDVHSDYEHLFRLSKLEAADLEGLPTTAVGRDRNRTTFHLMPEQARAPALGVSHRSDR